jgi:hypothetical protein
VQTSVLALKKRVTNVLFKARDAGADCGLRSARVSGCHSDRTAAYNFAKDFKELEFHFASQLADNFYCIKRIYVDEKII